jgi:hypothetical protein
MKYPVWPGGHGINKARIRVKWFLLFPATKKRFQKRHRVPSNSRSGTKEEDFIPARKPLSTAR